MSTVIFKSERQMFEKERSGIKPNTFRKVDYNDDRFNHLRRKKPTIRRPKATHIEIQEVYLGKLTGRSFQREITDYTEWSGWAIISWRHEL